MSVIYSEIFDKFRVVQVNYGWILESYNDFSFTLKVIIFCQTFKWLSSWHPFEDWSNFYSKGNFECTDINNVKVFKTRGEALLYKGIVVSSLSEIRYTKELNEWYLQRVKK